MVYILSTTVIQGIVPNAELAESTGPFGLAFAKMFNPMIGQIVMALAAMACVGSLLGWQFTLATTAKDAADARMFPGIFGKVDRRRRADHGHGHHGHPAVGDGAVDHLAQPERAVRGAGEPGGGDQRGALHHFAVGAVRDDARRQGRPGVFKRNAFVAVVAMLYSVYALWASGKDAVMGGMLVMGWATSSTASSRRASSPRRPQRAR